MMKMVIKGENGKVDEILLVNQIIIKQEVEISL